MKSWRAAVARACVCLLALGAGAASAQPAFKTVLNPAPDAPVQSTDSFAAASPDGAIVVAGFASVGDFTRLHLTRLSTSGTEQWTRWAGSGAADAQYLRDPLVHADNSVTLSYRQGTSHCIENFASDGARRLQHCFDATANAGAPRILRSADDEIFYAAGATPRMLRKLSRTGGQLWGSSGYYTVDNENWAAGVDSAGNYVEVFQMSVYVWNGTTGGLPARANLPQSFRSKNLPWNTEMVMRAGRDMVLLRDLNVMSPSVTNVAVGRFANDGSLRWSVNLSLPTGGGAASSIRLYPADNDGIYVVQASNIAGGASDIVKLSAAGGVIWQRNYAMGHGVVQNAEQLSVIRSDSTSAQSNSYVFRVAMADGALAAPLIYSRDNSAVPSAWFALPNGMLATFSGVTNSAEPDLASNRAYLGIETPGRWIHEFRARRAASVRQANCLMPRLAESSPSGHWSRTQTGAQAQSPSDWTAVSSSGSVTTTSAVSAPGCGPAMANDDSRIVVGVSPRAQRVSSTGAVLWTANSALTPATGAGLPVQTTFADGSTAYQIGHIVGRVDAQGAIVFETALDGSLRPRFLAVDTSGHSWSVSAAPGDATVVKRLSPAGSIVWSTSFQSGGCEIEPTAARLDASERLLLVTRSACNGSSTLYRFSGAGSVELQRSFVGFDPRAQSRLQSVTFDAAGNIYAGGCVFGSTPAQSTESRPLVASWTAAGDERWRISADLIAGEKSCVTSVVTVAGGNVVAAVSPWLTTASTRAPVLWSLTSAGVEMWRNTSVLDAPHAQDTELLVEASGRLIALGEAAPTATASRTSTLRAVDLSAVPSGLLLRILSLPSQAIGYATQIPVKIGIVDGTNTPAVRAIDTLVWLGVQSGEGNLYGTPWCTIPAGASSCDIVDARYDRVTSPLVLSVSADGFATISSATLSFVPANTSVVLEPFVPGPYLSYSIVRMRSRLEAPPPPPGTTPPDYLSSPFSPNFYGTADCSSSRLLDGLPYADCDFVISAGAFPVSASFSPHAPQLYNASSVSLASLPRSKQGSVLQVTPHTDNTYVAGDRVRYRVALIATTTNFNASTFVRDSISVPNGGTCVYAVTSGTMRNGYAGSYLVCEVPAVPQGENSFTFGFAGDDDLLPAQSVTVTATFNEGAVFARTNSYLNSTVTACTLTPGVTCRTTSGPGAEVQCIGPSGMTGEVFVITGHSGYFPRMPLRFNNVVGVNRTFLNAVIEYPVGSCVLDVDGDGARMVTTDGILILRAMLGLTGDALLADATHACSPRNAAATLAAIPLPKFDLDGDGVTRADTDGLLLLRIMLGFDGNSLVQGALGQNATRVTSTAVKEYLSLNCR